MEKKLFWTPIALAALGVITSATALKVDNETALPAAVTVKVEDALRSDSMPLSFNAQIAPHTTGDAHVPEGQKAYWSGKPRTATYLITVAVGETKQGNPWNYKTLHWGPLHSEDVLPLLEKLHLKYTNKELQQQ